MIYGKHLWTRDEKAEHGGSFYIYRNDLTHKDKPVFFGIPKALVDKPPEHLVIEIKE